jgi:hypothetical protein
VVEPDVIGTGDRPPRPPQRWALPAAALAAAALAAVVISANAREHAPLPTPPVPAPPSIGQSDDVDVLDLGGACIARDARGGRLVYVFGIENVGPRPLEILSVSRRAAGLLLVTVGLPTGCDTDRAPPPFSPFRLAPGESRLVLLHYRVTNCAAARSSDRTPATVTARQLNGGSEYRNRIGLPVSASGPCG